MAKPKTHERVLISLPKATLARLKWNRREFGVPVSVQLAIAAEASWKKAFKKQGGLER